MIWDIAALLIAAVDQIVKYLVTSKIGAGETISGIKYIFDIVSVKNSGAAFSMFSGRVSVLSLISVAFCVLAVVYEHVKKPKHPLMRCSIALLLGGALGNAVDRIFRGYVVDFIKITFVSFPVFNIADIAITVGAALLIIYEIFFSEEK